MIPKLAFPSNVNIHLIAHIPVTLRPMIHPVTFLVTPNNLTMSKPSYRVLSGCYVSVLLRGTHDSFTL